MEYRVFITLSRETVGNLTPHYLVLWVAIQHCNLNGDQERCPSWPGWTRWSCNSWSNVAYGSFTPFRARVRTSAFPPKATDLQRRTRARASAARVGGGKKLRRLDAQLRLFLGVSRIHA